MKLLEIGLGQGADSEQIIRRGARWSGLDLTAESVARLRTRLELRQLPYDELKQGSALAIPYPDNAFDKVFSHGVLHHIPDIRLAEREIARVLKPRGELIMMVYAKGREADPQSRPAPRTGLVRGRRLAPGRHRRNPHRHAARIAKRTTALARLHQYRRKPHGHCAPRLPQREAMALGLDRDALDRSRYAGSGQRLPATEGSQATSSVTCRSGSTPERKLTPRRPCSPNHRRVTSTMATAASQCSTKSGTSPGFMGLRGPDRFSGQHPVSKAGKSWGHLQPAVPVPCYREPRKISNSGIFALAGRVIAALAPGGSPDRDRFEAWRATARSFCTTPRGLHPRAHSSGRGCHPRELN